MRQKKNSIFYIKAYYKRDFSNQNIGNDTANNELGFTPYLERLLSIYSCW